MSQPTDNPLLSLLIGIGMAAVGSALLATKPDVMALPDAHGDAKTDENDPRIAQLAERSRNAITEAMPDNASVLISRPLILAGAALICVGLLDEIVSKGRN